MHAYTHRVINSACECARTSAPPPAHRCVYSGWRCAVLALCTSIYIYIYIYTHTRRRLFTFPIKIIITHTHVLARTRESQRTLSGVSVCAQLPWVRGRGESARRVVGVQVCLRPRGRRESRASDVATMRPQGGGAGRTAYDGWSASENDSWNFVKKKL